VGAKIAYIMSRFPHLPETFILREMIVLENLGWEISLYPLILQNQIVVHPDAQPWIGKAHFSPWISCNIAKASLSQFKVSPQRFISLFVRVVRENFNSLGFLIRSIILFPKAVWMAEQIAKEEITHIHAHYATHPALVAWIIHKLTGIPYSLTVHAHDIFVDKSMLTIKLRDAAFIVAISKFNREYLVDCAGDWVRKKIHVVHCGVDVNYYASTKSRGMGDSPFEVLSIGSLQPYKGMEYLIEAIHLLKKRNVAIHCRIVGEGKERTKLERLIVKYELESMIELLGAQTQEKVAHLLSNVDCYVQPSIVTKEGKMEGIPVSIMEALASGLPVIATNISGIPELVEDGKTGWLIPPNSSVALADTLEIVISNQLEAIQRAHSGQKLVMQEFSIDENVKELATLFQNWFNV